MQRLPLETQTLCADLLKQLAALEARRSIGLLPGCFTTKVVKGDTSRYFQCSHPGSAGGGPLGGFAVGMGRP